MEAPVERRQKRLSRKGAQGRTLSSRRYCFRQSVSYENIYIGQELFVFTSRTASHPMFDVHWLTVCLPWTISATVKDPKPDRRIVFAIFSILSRRESLGSIATTRYVVCFVRAISSSRSKRLTAAHCETSIRELTNITALTSLPLLRVPGQLLRM